MKAAQIDRYGKISDVVVRDVPLPHLAAGQVLVKVQAAAINPVDVLNVTGAVKLVQDYRMPLTLGNELIGTVEKVATNVGGFKPGDLVYGRLAVPSIGSFAEYVAVDAHALAPAPEGLALEEAAAVPLTGLTAWQALTEELEAQPGQTVLITGGSGGLGQLAVPIAKHLGLNVFVTGSARSRERMLDLGADRYFDYRTEDYAKELASTPVDHIIDGLGEAEFARELSVLVPGGRLLSLRGIPNGTFARAAGLPLSKRLLFSLAGSKLDRAAKKQGKKYRFMYTRADGDQLRRVTEVVRERNVHPDVDPHSFGLDEVREALNLVANGHPTGKVVLHIS